MVTFISDMRDMVEKKVDDEHIKKKEAELETAKEELKTRWFQGLLIRLNVDYYFSIRINDNCLSEKNLQYF